MASGRVHQSFPIIYIQLLISLHLNWEWERVCSFASGRVTVEKLSVHVKYMAVLMYTFGVFCSEQGAEDECACAVRRCVDGCESQCRAWKGGDFFFSFGEHLPGFLSFSGLSVPHEEFFII